MITTRREAEEDQEKKKKNTHGQANMMTQWNIKDWDLWKSMNNTPAGMALIIMITDTFDKKETGK